jgi:acyl-CoA synthetase (NDP forming)
VWRNIDDETEMRDAWTTLTGQITDSDAAGFVVQRVAEPGVPVEIGGVEDPLFGPTVSFSIAGSLTDLVGDRAYRIPPITPLEASEMVRELKAAPLLFGYRGSELVDVPAVEVLLRRVALLKNDLPQLGSIDLSLVHATASGVRVLSARAHASPVTDARSDWFARRLSSYPGDSVPG